MCHTYYVSPDNLKRVAQKVVHRLDAQTAKSFRQAGGAGNALAQPLALSETVKAIDEAVPPSFELGETFALYTLGLEAIKEGLKTGADLIDLAKSAERWHHQIKVNKQTVGYARSAQSAQDPNFCLCQLYLSDVARAIAIAIKQLDDLEAQVYADCDPLVHLLFIPAYYVYAFWVIKEHAGQSDVFVIDAPLSLQDLQFDRVLSSQEFLAAFRNVPPPIGGLRPARELSANSPDRAASPRPKQQPRKK